MGSLYNGNNGEVVMVGKLTDDTKLSCSQLAPFVGAKDPFKTRNSVLKGCIDAMSKDYKRNEPEPFTAMHWGNTFENEILLACASKLKIKADIDIDKKVVHKTLPLQGSPDGVGYGKNSTVRNEPEKGIYTPDGAVILDGPGILEAKLTSARPSDLPAMFRGVVQAQGLMMCTGYKWCAIPTLYGGINLRIYVYQEDTEMQKQISNACVDFNYRLKTFEIEGVTDWYDVEDPFDGSNTYIEDFGLPPVKLVNTDKEIINKYLDACSLIKSGQKIKDECTAYFMSIIGNHSTAEGQGYRVEWKTNPAKKGYFVNAREASRSKSIKVKEI